MTSSSTPPSGLYVRISAETEFERTLQQVRQIGMVINRSAYEQNMHVIEIAGDDTMKDKVGTLVDLVKGLGLIAILRGPLKLAKDLNADGLILADIKQFEDARAALGEESIIGITCDLGRPEAEMIIKQNVDYIIFGHAQNQPQPSLDLLRWWSSATDISSVMTGAITNDNAKPLVQAGATFLDCTDYILQHPEGVLQSVVNMLHAIDLAAKPHLSALN